MNRPCPFNNAAISGTDGDGCPSARLSGFMMSLILAIIDGVRADRLWGILAER